MISSVRPGCTRILPQIRCLSCTSPAIPAESSRQAIFRATYLRLGGLACSINKTCRRGCGIQSRRHGTLIRNAPAVAVALREDHRSGGNLEDEENDWPPVPELAPPLLPNHNPPNFRFSTKLHRKRSRTDVARQVVTSPVSDPMLQQAESFRAMIRDDPINAFRRFTYLDPSVAQHVLPEDFDKLSSGHISDRSYRRIRPPRQVTL